MKVSQGQSTTIILKYKPQFTKICHKKRREKTLRVATNLVVGEKEGEKSSGWVIRLEEVG
jgi:hypothetical protein